MSGIKNETYRSMRLSSFQVGTHHHPTILHVCFYSSIYSYDQVIYLDLSIHTTEHKQNNIYVLVSIETQRSWY